MSLKTTPRGLLAALAALCIILLQLPAAFGSTASAASAGAAKAAAPARHHAASHAGIRPHAQTVASNTVRFTNTTTDTATFAPTAAPAGAPITVTGVVTGGLTISVTVTGGNGATTQLGTTTSVTPTGSTSGSFSFNALLPNSITGTATLAAAIILSAGAAPTQTASTTMTVNAPTLNLTLPASSALIGGASPQTYPITGPHCITATLTGSNFQPGVAIAPTIVYTSGGVTSTAVLTNVTPISDGTSAEGDFTATVDISPSAAYSSTAVISVATSATYPYTPAVYPTYFFEPAPVLSTSATDFAGSGGVLSSGPLGPQFVAGMTNTLNIVSSGYVAGTSGTYQPNSPITLTFGLSGTAGTVITPTAPVTSDAAGVFTATVPFSVPVAGTYVVTGTDLGSCNVATTTITVVSPSVPGPPVSTTYFPEGYTGQGATNGKATFRTTYDLLNPNVSTVIVTNTYVLEQGSDDITPTTIAPDVVVVTHTIPALADLTVDAAADIASQPVITGPDAGKLVPGINQRVATIVQTAGFQGVGPLADLGGNVRGVAAERIIERSNNSGQRLDGDVSLGSTSANTSYYFAEGYTGFQFQEYLLLLNPSPKVTATVTILRVPEGTATALPPLGPIVLAPYQRLTINVRRLNALSPENKIGLIVNSADNPIVAERVEYFGQGDGSSKPGENIAAGMTTAAKQLNFAYGSLTGGPDVANPVTGTIVPNSDVAQTVDDRPFIEVMNPNIAGQVIAGTTSGSAAAPGPAAHVTIQLRGEDGRLIGFFITDVDAGARFTLTYNDLTSSSGGVGFPGVPRDAPTRAGVFSAVVSSSDRVVAELAQYYGQGAFTPSGDANSGAPGIDLVGAPTGETDVLFPALTTADPASSLPLSNTVFLYNPGVNTIRVNGTFYGPSGVVAHQPYTIGPDQIAVIGTVTSTVGGAASGMPIPAGTTGAEFSTIQERGPAASGEPGRAPEAFVAAAVTHSADGSNWWGTQGLYPLPVAPSCSNAAGAPLPGGCP